MVKGKVVLLPFPFDDLSSSKVRPAVCLTDLIGPHRQVVVAFITSQIPDTPLDSDIILEARKPDRGQAQAAFRFILKQPLSTAAQGSPRRGLSVSFASSVVILPV